jgi:DNA-binding response OmpR family regulator
MDCCRVVSSSPAQRRPEERGVLILLVEPDEDLREILMYLLRRAGHEVLAARDEPSACARIAAKAPRLVITEVALPEGSGWTLCQQVVAKAEAAILLLGESGDEDPRVRALELGAEAYMPKPLSPRLFQAHVQAALRRVHERQASGQPGLQRPGQPLQAGDLILDPQWRLVRRGAETVRLTQTEFKLLQELALHEGQVLPYATLVDRVWGLEAVEMGEDASLLKGHVRNLRRKLGDDGERPRYVHTVAGVGYSFRPQEQDAAAAPGMIASR